MSAESPVAKSSQRIVPVFKVWADEGSHPPVKLDRPVCVIGRREIGVNLPLSSPRVSKMHALIVRDVHGVYVRDLASTNGVERNGVPVQEAGLSDDDILRIGSYTFRCDSGFSYEETQDTLPAAELSRCERRARMVQEHLMTKLRWRE